MVRKRFTLIAVGFIPKAALSNTIIIILLISFLHSIHHTAIAQEWTHNGPWSSDITYITVNPHDTLNVFASNGYPDGGFWISNDGGLTFEDHTQDLPVSMGDSFDYIVFHPFHPDSFIVVGNSVIRTFDNGNSWDAWDLDFIDGEWSYFYALPASEGILLCVDYIDGEDNGYYRLLRSEDFGDNWVIVDSVSSYSFESITYNVSNPSHVVIVYQTWDDLFSLRESLDGGLTWTTICDDIFDDVIGFIFVSSIHIDPNDSGHFVFFGMDIIYRDVIYQSPNSGIDLYPIFEGHYQGYFQDSDGNLYYAPGGALLKSTDFGDTWFQLSESFSNHSLIEPGMYNGCRFADNPHNSQSLYVANCHGLFHSYDGGNSFSIEGKGFGYSTVDRLYGFQDESAPIYATCEKSGLWRENEDNETWHNITAHLVYSIDCVQEPPPALFICGSRLFRSFNYGNTLEILPSPVLPYSTYYLSIISFQPIIFIGSIYGDIWKSPDNGLTWENQDYEGWLFKYSINELDLIYRSEISDSLLHVSNDYGESWDIVNDDVGIMDMIFTNQQGTIFCDHPSAIFAVEWNGEQVLYSTDGGYEFTNISGNLPATTFNQLAIRPETLYELHVATPVGVYYTSNLGESWDLMEGEYDHNATSIAFSSDGTDVYVGSNNGIWKCENMFSCPDQDSKTDIPTRTRLCEIYPNPFNPATTITVELAEPSELKISVFNLIGREVAVLADQRFQAGYHDFVFDGSGLSSGIYFVKATIPENTHEVRKVVLIR